MSTPNHVRLAKSAPPTAPSASPAPVAAPNMADKKALSVLWQTPERFFVAARTVFGGEIALDPATSADNPAKARRFFTPADDGLKTDWLPDAKQGVWLNPPFGKDMKLWLARVLLYSRQGCPILALLPANRFEQGYIHEFLGEANTVLFVRKRVSFIDPATKTPAKGNIYPSMLVGMGVDPMLFKSAFDGFGLRLAVRSDGNQPG